MAGYPDLSGSGPLDPLSPASSSFHHVTLLRNHTRATHSHPVHADGETHNDEEETVEVAVPLEAINRESEREISIRHGHPSTLHLWWAR